MRRSTWRCGGESLEVVLKLNRRYDPVTYFEGSPSIGDPAFSSTYESATYYFASEANKTKFDAKPESFAAQYGGWCAYAMSEGKLFDVDPTRFKINDGKLYAFYRGAGGDTLLKWEENEPALTSKASRVWQSHGYSV